MLTNDRIEIMARIAVGASVNINGVPTGTATQMALYNLLIEFADQLLTEERATTSRNIVQEEWDARRLRTIKGIRGFDAQCRALIAAGDCIGAIKHYRIKKGGDLLTAKKYIDKLRGL